jgi:choice-of-anchor B domain-containing protein
VSLLSAVLRLLLPLVLLLLCNSAVWAHAEHDKARFVAPDGHDTGRCDKPLRPCKTIAYAVQQANKGDKVLVAAGHYAIDDEEQLFYLISDLVPVLGGYSRIDHFQLQAPKINRSSLSGIPQPLQATLTERGFHILRDGKAQLSQNLSDRLVKYQSLSSSQQASACINGKAGNFSCSNIDLVSHLALSAFSSRPSAASDVWGHVDLNTGTEYALIGLINGTAVVSLANPAAPLEVGTIAGSRTTWRDIKVYQYFDTDLRRWQAYAYVSSEGSDGIQIIDLNRLPASVSLAATYRGVTSSHNLFISGVDYSTNSANTELSPLLHLAGANANGGAVNSLSLLQPLQPAPFWQRDGATSADYSHDVAATMVNDERAQTDCQRAPCQVLFDFNESEVQLWDNSFAGEPQRLARWSYDQVSYVHSGWSSEDNRYLFVHDELDESSFNLNTTLRVFNLNNLRSPQLAKVWRGPSAAIDHNGFVRGNRYYMSNYQRGLTVLDITNPAEPTEAGYFDTFLPSDGAAFNGLWGTYPYLPSGLILGSDINSGLYVLADNSKNVASGSLAFSQQLISVQPGESARISVQRPQGSGAISVGYQSFAGSAVSGTDYQPLTGRLNWAADDNSSKTIELHTTDTGTEGQRTVFVRLFDPQGGATLTAPALTTVAFGTEPARPGSLSLVQQSAQAVEGQSITLNVQRIGGSDGAVSVGYDFISATAVAGQDFSATGASLNWADGDSSEKTFTITLIDDAEDEGDESFSVQLRSIDGSNIGPGSSLVVTVLDNERNTAPVLSVGDSRQVNAGQVVTLAVTAQDAENDSISYQWQQVSGTAVTLQNAQTATASFVAPSSNSSLVFAVIATDSRGAQNSAQLTISVVVQAQTELNSSSGGGGLSFIWLLLLGALFWPRRSLLLTAYR